MSGSAVPTDDLRRVADAQARFQSVIEPLTDRATAALSALPGWTVGHVLAHVARNADSHVRRADAAARGESVDQYPGGHHGRAGEIEGGTGRPARALVDDVARSAERLWRTWQSLPVEAWGVTTRDVGGRERPLRDLPARRWQELEVHLVDLGLGVTFWDWPDPFVAAWLPRLRVDAGDRLPGGSRLPPEGTLDDREELAWLYGRLRRADLPDLAHWDQ